MTRDDIREDILHLDSNYILAELPTSVGKSKIALDFMNSKTIKGNILIVIPRLVLIQNWKEEFIKWGYDSYLSQVIFTTYISLYKHTEKNYDLVIFDECHHLSQRAQESVEDLKTTYALLLSATVTKSFKKEILLLFPKIKIYKISMREAIEDNILPDPKVFLVPLTLNNTINSETLIINPKAKLDGGIISFSQRFNARKDKKHRYIINCTQEQYYQDLSALTDFYKRNYFHTNNQAIYFRWQQKAKERLVWLSESKNAVAKTLLHKLENKRTLTFCNSISQTKELGKYCINSENSESLVYLELFNTKKINHITACNILNEGCNLTDCQVGVFVSINSSDIMTKQKNGRILRHKNPIIFILYYKNTREEEIVNTMMENYNPKLVAVLKPEQLNDIKTIY